MAKRQSVIPGKKADGWMAEDVQDVRKRFKNALSSHQQSEEAAKVSKKSKKAARKIVGAPHLMCMAGPGCGKTTTVVGGIMQMCGRKPKIKTPSAQQLAIWQAMSAETADEIRVCAFSKAIEMELSKRLADLSNVEVRTCHGFGNSFLRSKEISPETAYSKMEPNKTVNLLEKITGLEYFKMRNAKIPVAQIEELVRLSKMNMLGVADDDGEDFLFQAFEELIALHGIECGTQTSQVMDLSAKALLASKQFERNQKYKSWWMPEFDFADMIWLPIALKLDIPKVDLIVVDEAQDLNLCQQEICLRMADRIVLVGDPRQAIFAFAGADSASMTRMETRLSMTERKVETLPLSITYRCGKQIVNHCCELFPDMLQAGPDNPEGEIVRDFRDTDLVKALEPVSDENAPLKDMVLCRVNAPLVSVFFQCLSQKKKARIQGRDIGQGLIKLIDRLKADSIPALEGALMEWHAKELAKIQAKKFINEGAIVNLNDKLGCLLMFAKHAKTVQEVRDTIAKVFDDKGVGILLTSIHRSKGLEADRVFIIKPEKCPHPMAKTSEARQQEIHLQWVARSRAINTLVYVKTTEKDEEYV